MTGYVRVT